MTSNSAVLCHLKDRRPMGPYAWSTNSLPIANGTISPYLLTLAYRYVSAIVCTHRWGAFHTSTDIWLNKCFLKFIRLWFFVYLKEIDSSSAVLCHLKLRIPMSRGVEAMYILVYIYYIPSRPAVCQGWDTKAA